VLGATRYSIHLDGIGVADGTFASWLGQLQWVGRLPERFRSTEMLFRADLQLARDPLLPLEQFAVGGSRTVRGYRQNQLLRDNGFATSIELRIPLLRGQLGRDLLQLAPFADLGGAWNEAKTGGPKTLASVGLGLR
jgi:hemolysin activation/secretion protein